MTDRSALEGTSLTERLVLNELAALERNGRTPVQAMDVLGRCRERLEQLDEVAGGRLTEGELVRACRTLRDRGVVSEIQPDATSPVGKGRPAYELDAETETVQSVVREDARLTGLPAEDAT